MSTEAQKEAKAEAAVAKAKAKALRPFYKKKRFGLLAVVAIIVVLAVAGSASSKKSNTAAASNGGVKTLSANGSHPPQADVSITGCSSADGFATAKVSIDNHSTGQSDYMITVAFDNASGTQIATGDAFTQNVDGGQTALDSAVGVVSGSTAGMKCVLKSVDRTASL